MMSTDILQAGRERATVGISELVVKTAWGHRLPRELPGVTVEERVLLVRLADVDDGGVLVIAVVGYELGFLHKCYRLVRF